MKKVLLAFDGCHFSNGVFEFVKNMNQNQKVLAIGMFLPSIDYVELLYSFGGVPAGPVYVSENIVTDEESLKQNILHFEKLCAENGIKYQVHKDFSKHIVTSICEETRFADLLVLSADTFYENLGEDSQDDYLANVLHKTECPVVLVNEKYKAPENIIMAYDGSEQSVFAIKQFSNLLPEYVNNNILIAYFDSGKGGVPEKQEIEEYLALSYSKLAVLKLKINIKKDLEQWLELNGNTMVVAGAFGRSLISELFKKSFIYEVIRQHNIPIFIAHK